MMNKEIKEILDYFRKYSTIRENTMITEIEDYIINLQESEAYYYGNYKDCASRIDKSIEYIKERYDYILKSDFLDHDEQVDKRQILYLLNILTGGDNNE